MAVILELRQQIEHVKLVVAMVEQAPQMLLSLFCKWTPYNPDFLVVKSLRLPHIFPGKTYFMSLQLTGTANRYGFELSSLNGSNAQAGSFTTTSSTTTAIVTGHQEQLV
jgi:hypothetical protein